MGERCGPRVANFPTEVLALLVSGRNIGVQGRHQEKGEKLSSSKANTGKKKTVWMLLGMSLRFIRGPAHNTHIISLVLACRTHFKHVMSLKIADFANFQFSIGGWLLLCGVK